MTDVQIPKMGMQTIEVDIVRVHVRPGERVEPTTVVVEVQSEKANFEVEAGVAGTVTEVLVVEGQESQVGDTLLRVSPS
jgi:pyruvate/2-oxoglutarate dehydrogenase complex dihydrolipoamide acyltransferase (E2) component